MNQENAYSKGCKVKYLLKSKTSVDLVGSIVKVNFYMRSVFLVRYSKAQKMPYNTSLITLFIIKRNHPSKSISKLPMQSLKVVYLLIPKALDAATP